MDIFPWNLICPCLFSEGGGAGSDVGGTQSKLAFEKPPTSLSQINLQSWVASRSWKEVRTYGRVGLLTPSAFKAGHGQHEHQIMRIEGRTDDRESFEFVNASAYEAFGQQCRGRLHCAFDAEEVQLWFLSKRRDIAI